MRLRQGLIPIPNCTGEEMALHTMFDYIEESESPESSHLSEDPDYVKLPRYPNDENWNEAKEYCFEDFDVLEVFKDEHPGHLSDSDEEYVDLPETTRQLAVMCGDVGQQVLGFAHMHPSEWFHVFRTETFWADVRDHEAGSALSTAVSQGAHGAELQKLDLVWTKSGIDQLKRNKIWVKWGSPTAGDAVPYDIDDASRHVFYMHGHLRTGSKALVWTQIGIDHLKTSGSAWVKFGSPSVGDPVSDAKHQSVVNGYHMEGYLEIQAAGKVLASDKAKAEAAGQTGSQS